MAASPQAQAISEIRGDDAEEGPALLYAIGLNVPPMAVAEVVTGLYLIFFAVGRGRTPFAISPSSAMDV